MKEVPLVGTKAAGRVTLVDDDDWPTVAPFVWYIHEYDKGPGCKPDGPYAVARVADHRLVRMHKFLTGWPRTDHRDHDGLNNQRWNLRPTTLGQNMANTPSRQNSVSRFKGVRLQRRTGHWEACIKIGDQARHLGTFLHEQDAAVAFDDAAREAWGEYACLNFPKQMLPQYREPVTA